MYYSRGYRWLLSINPRYRYVYTVAVSSIFTLAWLFFWHLPIERRIQQFGLEIKQCKKNSDQYAEQQILCKKLTHEVEQLQQDIAALADALLSTSKYVSQLMQYTHDAGLRLVSIRATEQKDHGWYTTDRLSFDATGTLAAATQFFLLLAKHQLCVQCDDVLLQRQADDVFLLHCTLRRVVMKSTNSLEIKSPSTLKKAEGLGG